MLRAIIRLLFLNFVFLADGLMAIIFDNSEITHYKFFGKDRETEEEKKQEILREYLRDCYKLTSRENNGKSKKNKKDDKNKEDKQE